ncbi:hypothetical protein N4G70_36180 [Streptomyces sp. ASQP_92]|uniref:hypothetical protein n=1 Tax=Streptomyces sp. ASQP_92 TaxID=2979116 RepID=UPI0021C07AB2|nr:hypothetical protein [Streptomyces sp. ASQP_92]MCT9094241.1 hypothetical protein [Streptomyces sp. ASQP_92]
MPDKRPRGAQPNWRPRRETQRVLAAVDGVLDLYADYLPVTLRQIFYVLTGEGVLAKTLRDYKRLGEYVGMARRSGRIPWSAIRDDKQAVAEAPPSFIGPGHFWRTVEAIARDYRVDRQHGQVVRLELWSETEGMVPQLARVGEEFGISCYSGGGFDGLAGKHDAAERAIAGGKETCILHIGDYDASGEWILTALAEDVTAFAAGGGAEVEFVRVAVTPEQVEIYQLPTALPSVTDRRSFSGSTTTQAESLTPDVLAAIVREAIESRRDMNVLQQAIEREPAERQALVDRLTGIG